jgi:hypothetical protein
MGNFSLPAAVLVVNAFYIGPAAKFGVGIF